EEGAHLFPQRLARRRQGHGVETEGNGHGVSMVSARPNRVKPSRSLEMDPAVQDDRRVRAIAHAQFLSTGEPREGDLAARGFPGPAMGGSPAVPAPSEAQFL